MTEAAARPRRPRLPKVALRTWAWVVGAIAFFTPWAILGQRPAPAGADEPGGPRRVIVVRRIIRRVVIHESPQNQQVRYVYVGGSGGSSSSGGGSAPATSTGGS